MGQANNSLKQATLQALGYVCEEMGKLDEDVLNQTEINNVLTAVAQGMRPDEADSSVRLAATVALNNALEFAHSNFDNADERNYIMQCICEGAVSPDSRLQEAAFECLVKVAGSYYEKLPVYIQDIFKLSHRAITQGTEEDVAKQAIEFWCTVAEEEIEAQEVSNAAGTQSEIRAAITTIPRETYHRATFDCNTQVGYALSIYCSITIFLNAGTGARRRGRGNESQLHQTGVAASGKHVAGAAHQAGTWSGQG